MVYTMKNSESVALRKVKARGVFDGSYVVDEHREQVDVFGDTSSSPACLEAMRLTLALGRQRHWRTTAADARSAYIQSRLQQKGVKTFIELPAEFWPESWSGFRRPVCPLILSLYGHPESGRCWQDHCTSRLTAAGFVELEPNSQVFR